MTENLSRWLTCLQGSPDQSLHILASSLAIYGVGLGTLLVKRGLLLSPCTKRAGGPSKCSKVLKRSDDFSGFSGLAGLLSVGRVTWALQEIG